MAQNISWQWTRGAREVLSVCLVLCFVVSKPERLSISWAFWITGISASILALALPFILYVICSVPRPTKSFWMTGYLSTGTIFLLLMKFFLVLKWVTLQMRLFKVQWMSFSAALERISKDIRLETFFSWTVDNPWTWKWELNWVKSKKNIYSP